MAGNNNCSCPLFVLMPCYKNKNRPTLLKIDFKCSGAYTKKFKTFNI